MGRRKKSSEMPNPGPPLSPGLTDLQRLAEAKTLDDIVNALSEWSLATWADCVLASVKRMDLSFAEATEECQAMLNAMLLNLADVLRNDQESESTVIEQGVVTSDQMNRLERRIQTVVDVFEILQTVWTHLTPGQGRSSKASPKDSEGRTASKKHREQNDTDLTLSSGGQALAEYLHDHWLQLQKKELQLACGRVFQFLSETFLSERPNYGTAYVLYLLLKINESPSGPVFGDVGRLLKCRDILSLIDFDDPGAQCLRQHLLRCCVCAKLYTSDVGQRFLSFIIGSLHPQLSADALNALREWIPTLRSVAGVIQAVSQVLHSAWRLSDGGTRLVLERSVEEMVELAILCEPKIAAKFREALLGFYRKNDPASSEFVCRSFPALVYRYVPVACWKVRFNATALFSVVFPLVDVSLPMAEYEADVERQYATLIKLTEDSHPEVRRVAVQGVCRVLLSYWEMVPVDKTTLLLDTLLTKAVKDKASPAVRAAVLEGLISVLNNPMSHIALNALFPKLADCIHDTSPLVRRTMAALLKRITETKGLVDVTSIVPIDSLLLRLVKDYTLAHLGRSTALARRPLVVSPEDSRTLFDDGARHKGAHGSSVGLGLVDCYQTSLILSELMFPSVLKVSDASLPKQVERILLMAEKFPLALLCIVDFTVNRLAQLDCARLAVAILRFASRKCQETVDLKNAVVQNNDQERQIRKHETLTCVLLNTAERLLREALKSHSASSPTDARSSQRRKKGSSSATGSSRQKSTASDNQLLKEFVDQNIEGPTFRLFLEPKSPAHMEALRLLFVSGHEATLREPWFKARLLDLFRSYLVTDAKGAAGGLASLSAAPAGVVHTPNAADALLDMLVTYSVAAPFHAKVVKNLVRRPLETILGTLESLTQGSSARDPKDIDRSDLLCCISLLQKGLSCRRWASSVIGTGKLLPTSLLEGIIRCSVRMMGLSQHSFWGRRYLVLEHLPDLVDVATKLFVQRYIAASPPSVSPDYVPEDLIDFIVTTVPPCLTSWSERATALRLPCTIVCETARRLLPSLGVWKACAPQRRGSAAKDLVSLNPETSLSRSLSSTDLAQFLAAFLQLTRMVSEGYDDTQREARAGSCYPSTNGRLCFTSAAHFVMLVDDAEALAPVQSLELLEPLLLGLPSAEILDEAWTTISTSHCVQRLVRNAPHSVETYVDRLDHQISSIMKDPTTSFDEHRRLRGIGTLLQGFRDLLPTDRRIVDHGDTTPHSDTVVVIPLAGNDSTTLPASDEEDDDNYRGNSTPTQTDHYVSCCDG